MYDFTLTHKGVDYRVQLIPDDCQDFPWEREDGHGPVRKSRTPHGPDGDKRAGERPLNQAGRNEYQFYYDWQAAARLAKRDGWNAQPYDAPARVQRAVQCDFDRLRRFLANDWCYVGVRVTHRPSGASADLWGIESDCEEYIRQVAGELADECLASGQMSSWTFAQANALCTEED